MTITVDRKGPEGEEGATNGTMKSYVCLVWIFVRGLSSLRPFSDLRFPHAFGHSCMSSFPFRHVVAPPTRRQPRRRPQQGKGRHLGECARALSVCVCAHGGVPHGGSPAARPRRSITLKKKSSPEGDGERAKPEAMDVGHRLRPAPQLPLQRVLAGSQTNASNREVRASALGFLCGPAAAIT